ncbi:MAG TPA: hypothetical protein VIX13_00500 [Candidatus Eisenbacteria bacterium]
MQAAIAQLDEANRALHGAHGTQAAAFADIRRAVETCSARWRTWGVRDRAIQRHGWKVPAGGLRRGGSLPRAKSSSAEFQKVSPLSSIVIASGG